MTEELQKIVYKILFWGEMGSTTLRRAKVSLPAEWLA